MKNNSGLGIPYKIARELMGPKLFWGMEHATDHLKIKISKDDLSSLKTIPFTEKMLISERNDHILAIKVGLSPYELYKKAGLEHLIEKFWGQHHDLAKIKGNVGWSLVRTSVVPDSLDQKLEAQKKLLDKTDRIPSVGTLINTIIAYRLLNGTGIFLETAARCIDSTEDLYRLNHCYHVSRTKDGRLYVSHFSEGARDPYLGLASRKKTIPEMIVEGILV